MKSALPTLESERLILRPFELSDASKVQCYAGSREVAELATIPHPYPDGMAEDWIRSHEQMYTDRQRLTLAIEEKESGRFIGAMTLHLELDHDRAEIGYWVGSPYWGNGFCTEAALCIIEFGQAYFGLNRVYGRCLARNIGSATVLQKLGMKKEGCLVKHIKKFGVYEDLDLYGMVSDK